MKKNYVVFAVLAGFFAIYSFAMFFVSKADVSTRISGCAMIFILAFVFGILAIVFYIKDKKNTNTSIPSNNQNISHHTNRAAPTQTSEPPHALWPDFGKDILPYYRNGVLTYINPRLSNLYEERNKFYHAQYIMSDGVPYNLHDADSIRSIAQPNRFYQEIEPEFGDLGVTGCLEYVLQRKAGYLREAGKHELSIILMQKAHELMWEASMNYTKKDYMRLVNWLLEDGRFDEAETYRNAIEQKFKVEQAGIGPHFINDIAAQAFMKALQEAKRYGSDYIQSCNEGACCSECAKYRDRIYSISGRDKQLPKIPSYQCDCSGITFVAWYNKPSTNDIARSNRPFVDDRGKEEKRGYQYVLDSRFVEKCIDNDRVVYNKLKQLLSEEDVPKSFSAFRRMKTANTKNFQILSEKASERGIDITMTVEEKAVFERYQAYRKEHNIK